MEQAPWKPILFAALASFVMLILIFVFTLPKVETTKRIDRILEFDASSIVGRTDGKKVWEFSAKTGWVGKNKDITNLKDVVEGTFYKDGELLIKNFTAEQVSAFRGSKRVEAKKAKAQISITSKRNKGKRKYSSINADFFSHNPDLKESSLSGNIRLIDKKTTLFSDNMRINHDKEIAWLTDNIRIKREDVSLTCRALEYRAKTEKILAQKNIRSTISGKEKTRIKSGYLQMYIDENKDVSISSEVEVIQGKKVCTADQAIYNKIKKEITLSGSVETIIERGSALIKEKTAQKLKDKKIKELLKNKTLQSSDTLILSTINGDYKAFGNIIVRQKGPSRRGPALPRGRLAEVDKKAKAERADYSDKNETITLTNNVYLKEKERWVKCQKVIISVKDKTFEASGQVEAEFKL